MAATSVTKTIERMRREITRLESLASQSQDRVEKAKADLATVLAAFTNPLPEVKKRVRKPSAFAIASQILDDAAADVPEMVEVPELTKA